MGFCLRKNYKFPNLGNNQETPNAKTQYWLLYEKKQFTNLGKLMELNTTFRTEKPDSGNHFALIDKIGNLKTACKNPTEDLNLPRTL